MNALLEMNQSAAGVAVKMDEALVEAVAAKEVPVQQAGEGTPGGKKQQNSKKSSWKGQQQGEAITGTRTRSLPAIDPKFEVIGFGWKLFAEIK